MTRQDTILSAAAFLFGGTADGQPEKGWVSKLARALQMTEGAVRATLKKETSPPFDKKLADLVSRRRLQMLADFERVESMEYSLNGGSTGLQRLFEVEIRAYGGRSQYLVYGSDAMLIAAHYLMSDYGATAEGYGVELHGHYYSASGSKGEDVLVRVHEVHVHTSSIDDRDLTEERRLVARRGFSHVQYMEDWEPYDLGDISDYSISDLPRLRFDLERAEKHRAPEGHDDWPAHTQFVVALKQLIHALERTI